MNILNYDIRNTKLFKKIMISICSMIMVFASCFAPYSKVKALVGIDDAALSYVALSVLGLCGITLAGTTLSNTDITKLGSEVAGSISRTFDTLDKTVSDKWNLLVHTAGATGKIALDYVNDLKVNIQDWWNGLTTSTINSSTIYSGLGLSAFGFSSISMMGSQTLVKPNKFLIQDYDITIGINYSGVSYRVPTLLFTFGDNSISISGITYYALDGDINFTDNTYFTNVFAVDSNGNNFTGDRFTQYISSHLIFNLYDKLSIVGYFNYPIYFYNSLNKFSCFLYKGGWTVLDKGSLELDPPSKVADSFKLDDRVLGETGALSLSDKIIGAVGSLDLDLTNNVVKSYGYVDVPSTTLDYPYTGTWDSTLDGIGAIAWAPSTDIPIADTNVIAPTIGGTTDTDIPKVKDFTGEGTDLNFDWKGVFPFCIPFDLIAFLKCLCAEPQPPKIDIPFNVPIVNYKGSVSIDLSKYDEVAALCRTLFDLLFIVGLAYATRYLIKG